MSESPYIPFYPSDWLAGTRGLTAAETGVYITLIAMMYEREAPIQMSHDRLARLCGTTKTNLKAAVRVLVQEGKLIETDAGLWNERVECECEKRTAKRESAKTSAGKRWEKTQGNQSGADANALRTHCEGNANQNQNQIYTHTNVCGADAPDEGFWDFCSRILQRSGIGDREARRLLGKWTKAKGRDEVGRIVFDAAKTADPVAFVEAAIKPKRDAMAEAIRIQEERRRAGR